MPTHAGAVAFLQTKIGPLFLVISSSDRSDWVLSKGHIESGEPPEETVLRELQEEAGVIGKKICFISEKIIDTDNEKKVVKFFLVECLGLCKPKDDRVILWVKKRSAMELLSYKEQKEAFEEGIKKLEEYYE